MLKQGQFLKQLQKLSPQQIQFMKLLQIPTVNIEERIKEEMEANPALEEGEDEGDELKETQDEDLLPTAMDDSPSDIAPSDERLGEETPDAPVDDFETAEEDRAEVDDTDFSDYLDEGDVADYKLAGERDPNDEDETRSTPVVLQRSFHEYLEEQLLMLDLDERQEMLARYIVGSIDNDGYMRRPLDAMVDDIMLSMNLSTDEKELEALLKKIQALDPPGIGARDLQECLLLQLDRHTEHLDLVEAARKIIIPTHDVVHLQIASHQPVSFTISDVSGRVVFNGNFTGNYNLSMKDLSEGLYFLRYVVDSHQGVIKLLK